MNKFGIHCPNKGFRELEKMLAMGVDNFTILHMNGELLPRIRESRPKAVILVRHYLKSWPERDPIRWARECAKRAIMMRRWTLHHTMANEQNLPEEGGGLSKEWFQRIDHWNYASIREFKRLCPWAIVHWPALASGHSEDQDDFDDGTIGYEICRRSIDLSDVLDHHDYWFEPEQLFEEEIAQWYAFRFAKAHSFFPDKPIFMSECGWFNRAHHPEANEHYKYFFQRLYDYPYVIGATPFIWDSGPEHGPQIWVGNEALIAAITQAEKPEVEYPKPPFDGEWVSLIPSLPHNLVRDLRGKLPTRPGAKPYATHDHLAEVKGVVIHWADASGRDFAPEVIARYQTGPRAHLAFPEIAYHLMVRQDGEKLWLLPLGKVSWHVEKHNRYHFAILAQPPKEAMWTEAQIRSLRELIAWLSYGCGRKLEVKLHRKLASTQCPGPFGERLLEVLEGEERRGEVKRELRGLVERMRLLVEEI